MTEELLLTVSSDCLLQHANPALLAALKKELTVANPAYRDARRYGRWLGKKLKPWLYFYAESRAGFHFPRGFASRALGLCRDYQAVPRLLDRRRTLPEIDFTFQGRLRPYQEEAFRDTVRREFGVIESGTGSGKTVLGLAIIAHRRQPTLVLVHTKELLHQWAAQVEAFLGQEPGLVGDGRFELHPVTIAIVNSARNHLQELPEKFGQIVVDECHRVPANLFTEVVTAFDCRYALGLSATAFRRDGLTELIHFHLGERTHRVNQDRLHRSGAVLKPEFLQQPTGFEYGYRGNYQNLLKALTTNRERNRLICADIIREAEGEGEGTILVVSDRVAHCQALATELGRLNPDLSLAVLTGQMPAEERTVLIDRIRGGQIRVLVSTVQLIGEGFDCPGLRTLFLTTPIKFSGRLLQVVGRILRPAADKKPRVYDYLDPVGVLKASARTRRLLFEEPDA